MGTEPNQDPKRPQTNLKTKKLGFKRQAHTLMKATNSKNGHLFVESPVPYGILVWHARAPVACTIEQAGGL
jgi:hypothetical protein